MTDSNRRPILLVHGAWHGGWCWRRVAERLRVAGHPVFTPTLTGLGERVHLRRRDNDLSLHIEDVLGVMKFESLDDVVVCGHSYGGMVITGVADRVAERLHALVYVDAYVPRDGESVLDIRPPEQNAVLLERVANEGDGWLMPPTPASRFAVESASDRDWVDDYCVPMALACFEQRIRLDRPPPASLLRHYVWAARNDNAAFRRYRDDFADDPSWAVHPVDCGHEVMIDRSGWLADLLLRVAASTRPPHAMVDERAAN